MKLRFFYFLAVFAGLVSCSDDESNTNNTPLLTFTAAAGSLTRETWVFLTKEDGTLIEAREITGDGADVVFERPKGFKDERFVVHQLSYSVTSRGFVINSYTGITGGELSFNPINPGTGLTEVGTHTYSVTNVPSNYRPSITGPKVITYSSNGVNGTFSGTVSLGAHNIDLLFWFQNSSNPLAVPKYTLVENVSAGQTLSMSFNDLIPASEQPFTFGVKQDFATVYVAPDSPELPPMPLYSVLTWSNATEIKLYHPGDVFDEYFTLIETRAGNDYQQYMTTGSLPTSFKSIPATITSLLQDANRLTVTTSGAYDYLTAEGFNRWTDNAQEYIMSWAVYMDDTASKMFTIPELPAVIVASNPALATAPLTGFNFVEIRDHSSLANYPDFISGMWNTKAFPPDTETLSRQKRFTE